MEGTDESTELCATFGLLYHFIEFQAKSMKSIHLRTKKFSEAIARKLGKFHKLSVPINKDAGWLFKTMAK